MGRFGFQTSQYKPRLIVAYHAMQQLPAPPPCACVISTVGAYFLSNLLHSTDRKYTCIISSLLYIGLGVWPFFVKVWYNHTRNIIAKFSSISCIILNFLYFSLRGVLCDIDSQQVCILEAIGDCTNLTDLR